MAVQELNAEEQVRALLNRETPLKDLYLAWVAKETSYMEQLWETVVEQAKQYNKEQREAAATGDEES